jgi:mannose-6-phosphate isomerase-like protein (cupin superfamily)
MPEQAVPPAGPRLPGAVGVSHLRVYESVGPDGLAGGTPHLHTACTEAYLVVSGRGRVQTLSADGFAETPLERGTVAWFSPGTVHRLVNDGDLELFVVMANAGLPEAGDMVITFDPATLADRDAYVAAATLPEGERTDEGTGAPARARRDAAVRGFLDWRERIDADPSAIGELHRLAAGVVQPLARDWAEVVASGPVVAAEAALAAVADLAAGGTADMGGSAVTFRVPPQPGHGRRMGCCGTLGVVLDH